MSATVSLGLSCRKCGADEWYHRKGRLDCKPCQQDRNRAWNAANRERRREQWHAWYAANSEHARKAQRALYAADPEAAEQSIRKRLGLEIVPLQKETV
jgi:hypothetical protein